MTLLEIAVQDPAGARTAFQGGADRIELCQALGIGGLTPSPGMIALVIDVVERPERIGVLVRPRGGGFVYSSDEVAIVTADIRYLTQAGITRLVVGALTAEGGIDAEALARWRDAAPDADFVFHRAIDAVTDPLSGIDRLVELGMAGILTSGGARRSIDAVDVLTALAHHSAGRLEIVAGGGVHLNDIPALVSTGVDAIHFSARSRTVAGSAGPGGGDDSYDITDATTVAAALAALAA